MKKSGFSIIEMIVVLVLIVLLTGVIIFVYITCFKAWNAGEDRSAARTELAQSIDQMTRDLSEANAVSLTSANDLLYTVGSRSYRFCLYDNGDSTYDLVKKSSGAPNCNGGNRLAHGVLTNVFSYAATLDLVGIDLTEQRNGITVRMRTNVRPRNL